MSKIEENKHKRETTPKKRENRDVKSLSTPQREESKDSTSTGNQSNEKNRKRVLSLSSSLHSSPNNSGFAHSTLGNLSNESLRSLNRRESVQDNLPSTIRHDNPFSQI